MAPTLAKDTAETADIEPQRELPRWLRIATGQGMPWLVLAIGVIFALSAWIFFAESTETSVRERFGFAVSRVQTILQRRMISHEMALRGGVGLFAASDSVSRSEWQRYVSALDLERNYPGVLGVGYSLRIDPKDRAAHEESVRKEGFADYAVRPADPRDEYHSIVFIEPFAGRNLRAFGYDMRTEATRRAAMDRARDTGQPALTGKITLVQEGKIDVQPGFLLLLPVYRNGMAHDTVEQRRAALTGFVYSPYRAHDLFGNLLSSFDEQADIEIFDGERLDADSLMYASPEIAAHAQHALTAVRTLDVAGQRWTLRIHSTPAIEATGFGSAGWIIPLMILTLSIMLFFGIRSLTTTSHRAKRLAREMTRELALSESRLHTILDTAADGIITLDRNRRITSFNLAASRIFGFEETTALGLSIETLVPEVSEAWLADQPFVRSNSSCTTETVHCELMAERVEGTRFPVALSVSRYLQNEAVLYTCTVRDITEKKMAEAQLVLRERALESSGNGIIISDMSLPNHPVIYANPAFEAITGFTRDEVIGRNCRFLQGLDGDQPALDDLREAIASNQPCTVVLRNYRKDGTLFWNELAVAPVLDANGRATHYVGVQNDITERMEAEETLMIRTHRLDAVFSLSPDGFAAFDENGRLTIANPALQHLTGMGLDELVGMSEAEFDVRIAALCDPSQPYIPLSDALNDAIAGQFDDESDGDFLPRSESGKSVLYLIYPERRVLERSVRLSESDQHEKVLYFRNITREAEVDRMKSEFLSTAAHELRTPMASIFGFAELLLKREYDDSARRRMHETIHRQAQLLINMVNELLDLARIEARAGKDFRRQVQPIRPIIDDTVAALLVRNDDRCVRVLADAELPNLNIDAEKVQQALTNVLSNAYKYSPQGGTIELTTTSGTRRGRPMLGICVRDEGIGMSPEQVKRVFERFYRADPSGNIPGTGLGMVLVKEIIELHGGEVHVESELGSGTTVTLWLPQPAADDVQLAA